jgi:hypothetical protein
MHFSTARVRRPGTIFFESSLTFANSGAQLLLGHERGYLYSKQILNTLRELVEMFRFGILHDFWHELPKF